MTIKKRHTIIPAVFLLLKKDNKLLLQRRRNTGHGDGKLSLVGGHVENGESAIMTLVRESKEEIGIIVNPLDVNFVYALHRTDNTEERIDLFFEVSRWKGNVRICEPIKSSEVFFESIEHLSDDVLPYIKHALKDINKGKLYGEYGWKYNEHDIINP